MEYVPNRTEELKREENKKIAILENKINMLERYLASKGYNVTAYDNRVERFYIKDYGTFSASETEIFR